MVFKMNQINLSIFLMNKIRNLTNKTFKKKSTHTFNPFSPGSPVNYIAIE